jgi:NAD(P)H-nitrite reductase large subunit
MPKITCRCEDLTEEEILEFVQEGYTTIDEIKRVSRASMGHCQGRTCKRLIAQIISRETGKPVDEIIYPTPRPPIKPVPLKVLANMKG